jgi:2-polyprenyl-3-methyl-5-hydroxy-6-metoxy-1,4-benzoquinol methylase
MIDLETIRLSYKLFLGRDPENEEVVLNIKQNVRTIDELREVFYKSAEFQARMGHILKETPQIRHRHPFNFPSIPVEVNVTEDVLQKMFERIHQEWEFLGEKDPYWSVVTQPHYHLDQFEGHREEFYASGKYSSDIFLAALRRNNINYNHMQTCMEVGCGVGRVTSHLAAHFPKLIAADISKHHIDLATQHLASQNITNVEFMHWSDLYALNNLPQVDCVMTIITLQHNPPPIIAWILKKLLAALKPGGVAYFQIPTYRNGYLFEVERYLHSEAPKSLEMHFIPQFEIFDIINDSGCSCLEVREDTMIGDEDKMLSNTFVVQKN